MAACQAQSSLNDIGAMIRDPSGNAGLVPGPLALRDRTIWWTGRVAIGLTHGHGGYSWMIHDNPCAASACSEFLEDPAPGPGPGTAAVVQGAGIARWMQATSRALCRLAGFCGDAG